MTMREENLHEGRKWETMNFFWSGLIGQFLVAARSVRFFGDKQNVSSSGAQESCPWSQAQQLSLVSSTTFCNHQIFHPTRSSTMLLINVCHVRKRFSWPGIVVTGQPST